jgi:hypothetical protein
MALILTVGFDVSKNEDKIRKQLDDALKNMSETQLTNFSSRVSGLTDIVNEVAREAVSGVSTSASTVTAPAAPAAPAVPVATTPSTASSSVSFFKQDGAETCGRNALNNMVGRLAFVKDGGTIIDDTNISTAAEPINLPSVCVYLQSRVPSVPFECQPNENYDITTLTAAMNILGFQTVYHDGYGESVGSSGPTGSVGAVLPKAEFLPALRTNNYGLINLGPTGAATRGHWVSARKEGDKYYYFDSLDSGEPPLIEESDSRLQTFRRAFVFSNTGKYIDPLAVYKKWGLIPSSTGSAPPAAVPPASVSTGTTGTAPPAAATGSKYTNDKSVLDEFNRLKGDRATKEIKPPPANPTDINLWTRNSHQAASKDVTDFIAKGDFSNTPEIDKLLADAVAKLKVFKPSTKKTAKKPSKTGGKRNTTYRRRK